MSFTTAQLIADENTATFLWSSKISVRQNRHGKQLLHNYTIYTDQSGVERSRWLKREFVPNPIDKSRWMKRSFGVVVPPQDNYQDTVVWPKDPAHPERPALIPLCYVDSRSQSILEPLVLQGIKDWHNKLGPNRGVGFVVLSYKICDEQVHDRNNGQVIRNPGLTHDTVHIQYDDPGSISATIGYYRRTCAPGRHRLFFNPNQAQPQEVARDAHWAMTHELGHVLGLLHEHQRPDAGQHITLVCSAIAGYSALDEWLHKNNWKVDFDDDDLDFVRSADEICQDHEMALEFATNSVPGAPPFNPLELMPQVPQDIDITLRYHYYRPYDLSSIMHYGSEQRGERSLLTTGKQKTLLLKDGSDIPWDGTSTPSDGDRETVNMMYPPIVQAQ
ncbi:hypothetical protein FKW77_009063 [Venturia effusa]|uniref:Metalloendopeptidase n=1 Tax=Venturia effusa TaxID=50376 RepID=A0A517LCV5_9PEZI|nr:hypothetical protein FKW77_009063 [Venturia effusa]